ncbi:MAG: hypothetical protein Q9227_007323 [Pyrenula ochraceoflavens]
MVHTVGIIGANGRVGASAAKGLAEAVKEGKIKLVILHRPGNAPKGFDTLHNVELRVLDLESPASEIEKSVLGIQVFISALGFPALPSEPKLVDALAKSPDLITYIPASYSTTWTPEEEADPPLTPIIRFIHGGWDRAKEKGIAVTPIYTGIFDVYFFEYGFVGCVVKQNTVWANEKQLQNRIPITAISHLGDALARIAASPDPYSIKNTTHSVVTFWPSGDELVSLYTKINGKQATVKDFTEKDRHEFRDDAENFGAAKVGYWDKWASGNWDYETGDKVYDRSYSGEGIEETARRFA